MLGELNMDGQTHHSRLIKIIGFVVVMIICFSLGIVVNKQFLNSIKDLPSNDDSVTRCFYGQTIPVEFIDSNVKLLIERVGADYQFNVEVATNSNVDFGLGAKIYLLLGFGDSYQYRLEDSDPAIPVNFDNQLPKYYTFSVTSKEILMTSEQLGEIEKFLNKEIDLLMMNIMVYNYDKHLIQVVTRVMINN